MSTVWPVVTQNYLKRLTHCYSSDVNIECSRWNIWSCISLIYWLLCLSLSVPVMSCEAATQTELGPGSAPAPGSVIVTEHGTVTLRQGRGKRKPRPNSMVDYQSYRDTKLLVARFLEQSSCSLTPEVQELVNSIKTVLRSDEEHMEEAVRCASFIDQARHMA